MELMNFFRKTSLTACGLISAAFAITCAVSCDGLKNNTLPENPDNFVNIDISDVSDGRFTVNFSCGDDTRTIEYAVCRAVNMARDSVAFASGELADIVTIDPENGKASVQFDFSKPLDFGPYTVYARAISAEEGISAPVKAQVCALTTGMTLEYFSRARYEMKATYHGDEFISNIWRLTSKTLEDSYGGSLDILIDKMMSDEFKSLEPAIQDGGIYIDQCRYNLDFQNGGTWLDEKMIVGYTTSNGSEITGAYVFEMPLPEKDPSVPLPENLNVEFDLSKTYHEEIEFNNGIAKMDYILADITKGNNTDCYFFLSFGGSEDDALAFGEDLMEMYPFFPSPEEALRWNISSGLFNYSGILGTQNVQDYEISYYSELPDGSIYESRSITYISVSVNKNGEPGPLTFHTTNLPDEWFEGKDTPDATAGNSSHRMEYMKAPVAGPVTELF